MPDINYTADKPAVCPTAGYQSASVCVSVNVEPFAEVGTPATQCCGEPVVSVGKKTCAGTKNGVCTFTITQDVCIAVPVSFGAYATRGDIYVDCIGASAEEDCGENCGAPVPAAELS